MCSSDLELDETDQLQLTVLNFANEPIAGTVRSQALPPGAQVCDMFSEKLMTNVDDLQSFGLELDAHQGMSLLVRRAEGETEP